MVKNFNHLLNTEDRLMLAGSKINPCKSDLDNMEQLVAKVNDWNYFTKIVLLNSLGPLLHKNLSGITNRAAVHQKTLFSFKQTYLKVLSRNILLMQSFRNAVNDFSAQGISIIGLKGVFLSEHIYSDIGLRQLSDIDILVRSKDVYKCQEILLSKGYISYHRKKTEFITKHKDHKHLPQLSKNGVAFELHTKIDSEELGFKIIIDEIFARAQPTAIAGISTLKLNPVDLIISLCVHLESHFYGGKIRFYYIVDIAEVLKHYSKAMDWGLLQLLMIKYNCEKCILNYLYLCNKYFQSPVSDEILKRAEQVYEEKTEKLFILYLKADRKAILREIKNSNIKNLSKVKGVKNKLRYLIGDIFPEKAFMYKRYRIKHKNLIYWYYFRRLWDGFIALLRAGFYRRK